MSDHKQTPPDRNLAMELVRVTEAAALASGRWVGRGKKNEGDGAAVDAMRQMIQDQIDAHPATTVSSQSSYTQKAP